MTPIQVQALAKQWAKLIVNQALLTSQGQHALADSLNGPIRKIDSMLAAEVAVMNKPLFASLTQAPSVAPTTHANETPKE
jgi:hypothetical protein